MAKCQNTILPILFCFRINIRRLFCMVYKCITFNKVFWETFTYSKKTHQNCSCYLTWIVLIGIGIILFTLIRFSLYMKRSCLEQIFQRYWPDGRHASHGIFWCISGIATCYEATNTRCPQKVPLEVRSFVVKHALSYLWELIIASKKNTV